jgi:hypothetical protein
MNNVKYFIPGIRNESAIIKYPIGGALFLTVRTGLGTV